MAPVPGEAAEVPAGEHRLFVAAEGYATVELPLVVEAGEDQRVLVQLQPAKIEVKEDRIELREQVLFDTAKATIRPDSHALLDEIAAVLNAHPTIAGIAIEGHTDSRGSDTFNLQLSKDRAASVEAYLIEKAVDPHRLESAGFGETRPLDERETAEAWERNRRVEIWIRDRKEEE